MMNKLFSLSLCTTDTQGSGGKAREGTGRQGEGLLLPTVPLLPAPQVIRKIRVEQFPDASGSLKLWCQFFNILSDSVLTWAKDQRPVGEVGRR